MMTGGAQRLHAIVRGRVQGVGFRATTHAEAYMRGLSGWVRNLTDGSVEVVAEGEEPVLRDFLAFLHKGPRGSHVVAVSATWEPAQGEPHPFEVRRTA